MFFGRHCKPCTLKCDVMKWMCFKTGGGAQFTQNHLGVFFPFHTSLGAQNHLPHQKILPQPFLLGIPTWLPRCLARWKSSKAPSKKKSYQPSKLMGMILLMEEILHHLGCIYNLGCTNKTLQAFFHQYFRATAQMMSLKAKKIKLTLKFQQLQKKFSERIPDAKTARLFFLKESRFRRHFYQCALVLESLSPIEKKGGKPNLWGCDMEESASRNCIASPGTQQKCSNSQEFLLNFTSNKIVV